jgi:hypothetical protein
MGQLLIDGSSAINSNAVNESVKLAVPSPELNEKTNVDRAHQLSSEPSSTDGSPAVSSLIMGAASESFQPAVLSPRVDVWRSIQTFKVMVLQKCFSSSFSSALWSRHSTDASNVRRRNYFWKVFS